MSGPHREHPPRRPATPVGTVWLVILFALLAILFDGLVLVAAFGFQVASHVPERPYLALELGTESADARGEVHLQISVANATTSSLMGTLIVEPTVSGGPAVRPWAGTVSVPPNAVASASAQLVNACGVRLTVELEAGGERRSLVTVVACPPTSSTLP